MYMSDDRNKYIRQIHKEKINITVFRIFILLFFLIGWEVLARIDFINTFTFSSPCKIFETLFKLLKDGDLFKHIGISLYEIIISFFASGFLGFIIAIILWWFPIVSKILDPYLTIINSLPKVALGPLIIIWVGASINSIIFMSLLISLFITIINIYNSFLNTDTKYIILMKSFGANKWQIFKNTILPSNYKNIINSFNINIWMNLIGLIMGELLVSKGGIGYLIMYGSQVFNINLVISGVFILGIISYLMYFVIDKFE